MIKYIFFLIIAALLSACSGGQSDSSAVDEGAISGGTIVVTKEQFQSSGMELAAMTKIAAVQEINVNGKVVVIPGHVTEIGSLSEGRVSSVMVSVGDWVKKGEALFRLEGPSIIDLQQEFLKAQAVLPVVEADYSRQKELLQSEIASRKIYEEARADFLSARATASALRARLELLGIDTEELERSGTITASIAVSAPIAGNVTMQNLRQGAYLLVGESVMEIVDPKSVFVELDVYETDMTDITKGMEVLVWPAGEDTVYYRARISRVAGKVDADTRSIRVQASLSEPAPALLPGMYVNATLLKESGEMYGLPSGAIVNLEERFWGLMKEAESDSTYTFVRREFETLPLAGEHTGVVNYEEFDSEALFLTRGAYGLIQ